MYEWASHCGVVAHLWFDIGRLPQGHGSYGNMESGVHRLIPEVTLGTQVLVGLYGDFGAKEIGPRPPIGSERA